MFLQNIRITQHSTPEYKLFSIILQIHHLPSQIWPFDAAFKSKFQKFYIFPTYRVGRMLWNFMHSFSFNNFGVFPWCKIPVT
jgi:hypothetical protein